MPTTAPATLPILIAGGGIGGLAAALALANKGVKVQVLEQAPALGEIGAASNSAPTRSIASTHSALATRRARWPSMSTVWC